MAGHLNDMMDEQKYGYRAQWLVLIGAGVLLILLLTAWISEGLNKEWRKVQKEYAAMLEEKQEAGYDAFERGIFQVELADFKRSDRCISCHHGLEDPNAQDRPQPHTTHPGTFLVDHPVEQYGCTICHGGQPGALSSEEAFGRSPDTHWPQPMLEQPYIQSSCGKCHLAIYSDYTDDAPLAQSTNPVELSEAVAGMDVFLAGKEIFAAEGCLGCHQARGVGGIVGPDLTEQGEKTKHEYSFQNIQGEQTISNWLKEHFKDPEMVSPGSQMLRINLDEGEMDALATFVMGLAKPDIPFEYFSMSTLSEFKGEREPMSGAAGRSYFCSACHGKSGEGKDYDDFKTGIPAIGNADFLRVASDDFMRFTLEKGRSLRQMGSWSGEISGLSVGELDELVSHLREDHTSAAKRKPVLSAGNGDKGEVLYKKNCVACHGTEGKGEVAVALNQQGFLSRAGDDFLLQTLLKGRGNTGMPGWYHLSDEELADLIAFISSWRRGALTVGRISLPEPDLSLGAERFHFLCFRCHGEFGEGDTGPAIINRDFLKVASDNFLYETIAQGRLHTAMFGWSTDVYNKEKLDQQEISNIIGFMRQSSESPLNYVYQGSNPGQHTSGAPLFEKYCATCHGHKAEGLKAPALQNQEFLSAASNGYLMATITVGRAGTDMPSWGYGDPDHPMLSARDREDLVAHIRSMQRIHIKY